MSSITEIQDTPSTIVAPQTHEINQIADKITHQHYNTPYAYQKATIC